MVLRPIFVLGDNLVVVDNEKEENRLLKKMLDLFTICCQEKSRVRSHRCGLFRQQMVSLSVE